MRTVPNGEIESPFDRFQTLVPDLVFSLREYVQVRTTCWLSFVAFSSTAQVVLPIMSLRGVPTTSPYPPGGQTDYVAALNLLGERIPLDRDTIIRELGNTLSAVTVARPLIFFITDGKPFVGKTTQPRQDWMAARDALTGPLEARVAAIGLPGADERVLLDLATGDTRRRNAFIANGGSSATKLADNVMDAIMHSVQRSTEVGDMVIETPTGMRRLGVER
jgi:uncharacterized protein YegL